LTNRLWKSMEGYPSIFDNMALWFECRINKNSRFGDFAHWDSTKGFL